MRRYTLIVVCLTIVVVATAYALSYFFEPIESDLTRMGAFSERDYGWNEAQPSVHIVPNSNAINNADIVVLGDSFSLGNVWQSVLSRNYGLTIQSYQYSDNPCILGWVERVAAQSSARTIVVETVEREFVGRLSNPTECLASTPMPFERSSGDTGTHRRLTPVDFHIQHSYLTLLNTLRVLFAPSEALEGKAINVPIDSGCARFSNRKSGRMLYYVDDDEKLDWKPEEIAAAVKNVERMQRFAEKYKKHFVFIVVPDKSSVYRHCMQDPKASQRMKAPDVTSILRSKAIPAPDVLGALRTFAASQVDLYAPNNTHFGTRGYIILAKAVGEFLELSSAVLPASK